MGRLVGVLARRRRGYDGRRGESELTSMKGLGKESALAEGRFAGQEHPKDPVL